MKYVKNAAGLHIAYWTLGDSQPDLIWVPNFTGNADVMWQWEPLARFLGEVASLGRLVQFDSAGTGGSDPIEPDALPTMEQWMDDVRCVMDAEDIERATLLSMDSGGPVATLFAATHPDRCAGLMLFDSFARLEQAPDYPIGNPQNEREAALDGWEAVWGTGKQVNLTVPELADDEEFRAWCAFLERASGPYRMRRPIFEMISRLDVRDVLPAVRVPTTVVHRTGDRFIRIAHGRYLAEHIPGARFVEVPGTSHYPFFGDTEPILREIREFVTGSRESPDADDERILATVLFTDIVDSTKRAVEIGDRRWREVLDRHDAIVRDSLQRFRGREIKSTGDGFLATFDGPARAVRCARAIRDVARSAGIDIRAGLHTGEIEIRGEDVGGLSVHVGARVSALAGGGEVFVSQTVKDLTIGSGLTFDERGAHELKGVPGEWRVYSVVDE